MSGLWKSIAGVVARWRHRFWPRSGGQPPLALICCWPVGWESEGAVGHGEVRHVDRTSLRLYTQRPLLVGRRIVVRSRVSVGADLGCDTVQGRVAYSRSRAGRVEVGVELCWPDQLRAFILLQRFGGEPPRPRVARSARPSPRSRRLRLVNGTPAPH